MVEATTGWLETYPVPHATARNTILGLEKQVLWRHGTPERIESDNGTHFKNSLINNWAREHGIEWVYHIPYHAPASGKIERYNGLLKTTLKALGGGSFRNWEQHLAKATWLVNTRGSSSRAGPAQSEPLHTVDGEKVPVVHVRVTSLLEKVQRLLNVKDTTFLVFHLVTFLYMVYSFSRMSHTMLNTVGQQIEAREQGDKSVTQAAANPTAIQAAAKPDSEAKTPAVAAVKKGKKHTDKTDRPVDDDSGEGSSMPPDTQSGVKPPDTQSEAEATDDTQSEAEPTDTKSEAKSTGTRSGAQPAATTSGAQPTAARAGARPTAARAGDTIESFSLKDLRGLRKDYTRRPDESIISWLVRLWDAAGEATILDGTEARHLDPCHMIQLLTKK
ncbi:hypothetical protein DUI87_01092 [Hirundo rustica rustica]|uniref:Integrase catalytic domain-containing protein n=1 Tax=Hirundo rustica rustica TaxID=333673 RepID=A0A3M0L5F1_HIRRU|nr:hypothetical protein DUI87_01092 [Hirundo rustica rustica]